MRTYENRKEPYTPMPVEKAVEELRNAYHKTRITYHVGVDAVALGTLLDAYEDLKFRMDCLLNEI